MTPHRVLARCILLALLAVSLPAREPMGRLVWTERTDGTFTLQTKILVPPDTDSDLYVEGPVKVDADHWVLTDKERADDLATADQLTDTSGSVPTDGPRSAVRYLHAAADVTGRRFMFTGGDTWGPNLGNTSAEPVSGGTALYFGHHADSHRFTSPAENMQMDAFPAADPKGEWVYFARFHYEAVNGGSPGWYLMRVARTDAEGLTAGNEELVMADGSPVKGSQPTFNARGTHLFFVRRDSNNLSRDLWIMPVDPDPTSPVKLMEAEGQGFTMPSPGGNRADWDEYSARQGRARIDHPSVSPDGRFVAYSCDRDGDWDLYSLTLQDDGSGNITAGTEERIEDFSDQDRTDEMWPSVSGDGAFVAYMSNRGGSSADRNASREGLTRIWIASVAAGDGPPGYDQLLKDPGNSGPGQMWPYWEQDEDPPHMLIVLQHSNGGTPTRIQLIDEDPDSTATSDIVSLSLELSDYYPEAPPPGSGIMPLFDPFEFGFHHGVEPVRIEYDLEDWLNPSGDDAGVKPFDQTSEVRRGNGFHMLLSGKRSGLGLHRGLGSFKNVVATGTGPGSPSTLTDEAFDGIFLFENERLLIDVYARDNRWLRIGPETPEEKALYSTDPVTEGTQLIVRDPRSLPGGPPRPPYLRVRHPEKIMDDGYPGVCWWIEEGALDETDESKLKNLYDNPPYVIFRFANYPPDEVQASQQRDLYLRVVARDLLSNVTDVRIPLHVRPKDFAASRLGNSSRRGR